jgi:hypothetical protein
MNFDENEIVMVLYKIKCICMHTKMLARRLINNFYEMEVIELLNLLRIQFYLRSVSKRSSWALL